MRPPVPAKASQRVRMASVPPARCWRTAREGKFKFNGMKAPPKPPYASPTSVWMAPRPVRRISDHSHRGAMDNFSAVRDHTTPGVLMGLRSHRKVTVLGKRRLKPPSKVSRSAAPEKSGAAPEISAQPGVENDVSHWADSICQRPPRPQFRRATDQVSGRP